MGGDGWDAPELFKIGGDAIDGTYFSEPLRARRAHREGPEVRRGLQGQVRAGSRPGSARSATTRRWC